MSKAGVTHNGGHIGEVEVDQTGNNDQVGDALDALTQHIVGDQEGVLQRDALVGNVLQSFVRDDDQRVNTGGELGDTLLGLRHALLAFKGEGFGDNGDGEDAHILRDLCDDGSSAGTGAAAHTGSDKDHVGVLEDRGDLLAVLLSGSLTDLGLGAGALAAGRLLADLYLLLRLREAQDMLVGVHCDELDVLDVHLDHTIDGVAAAAADADYLNDR